MPKLGESHLQDARQLLAASHAWDLTLPWPKHYRSIDVLRRFKAAGFTFASLTLQDLPATFTGTVEAIAEWRRVCAEHADWMVMVDDVSEIEPARAGGRLALGINLQDSSPIGTAFDRVDTLRRLGVWHMLLAYQLRNLAADGCAEPADGGLSLVGHQLIRRMNEVGMVVDCAHTGYRSSMDAMSVSARPVIFSHCGVFALCQHIRNVRDDQLKACAGTGGVIGLVGIGAFIGDPRARTETLFRHIDYVVNLVGPDHAAIGTDFVLDMEMIWRWMADAKESSWRDPYGTQLYEGGCFQPEQLTELVATMLAAGYGVEAVQAILSGNARRVYSDGIRPQP